MAICFLFAQHLHEDSCLSLTINQLGEVDSPLAQRPFSEIKALQSNTQTYVVAPVSQFSLHQLELPRLPERKARAAIPFALEERLAQNYETLHFAFDNNHYQNGHYLVAVCDKTYLTDLIANLAAHDLDFNCLTLDWFALGPEEIALVDSTLLVNDPSYQGALSVELSSFYLHELTEDRLIYCFNESNKENLASTTAQLIDQHESAYLWLARRLLGTKPMNLCQGDLQHGTSHTKTKRLYQAAGTMVLLWFLSILLVNTIKIFSLNHDIAAVDAKIATIYHEFFPQAKQVISPKFRISQLLKASQSSTDTTFWVLMEKLTKNAANSQVKIDQLRFQNQTLMVTLTTKNFESLDNFQAQLQQDKVKVKQTQASTQEQQVVSTLELNL